eukprot:TRINITY_DN7260_c0_g1_i1.p1 TRINITY_DN7260_c0_g1~~TRINITY_DN7260_c0_g1_i1.p1  ORF type:complete len:615 (-),score=135.56 TRINITY_DN7260_c0_g1_i1:17-1654(-)
MDEAEEDLLLFGNMPKPKIQKNGLLLGYLSDSVLSGLLSSYKSEHPGHRGLTLIQILEAKGLSNLFFEIDTDDPFVHQLHVFYEKKDAKHLIAQLFVRKSTQFVVQTSKSFQPHSCGPSSKSKTFMGQGLLSSDNSAKSLPEIQKTAAHAQVGEIPIQNGIDKIDSSVDSSNSWRRRSSSNSNNFTNLVFSSTRRRGGSLSEQQPPNDDLSPRSLPLSHLKLEVDDVDQKDVEMTLPSRDNVLATPPAQRIPDILELGVSIENETFSCWCAMPKSVHEAGLKCLREQLGDSSLNLTMIEWLRLQDPRKEFTSDNPPLPGQLYPGLGVAREIDTLLFNLAKEHSRDGILNIPDHWYNAYIYTISPHKFFFLNPAYEGWFRLLTATIMHEIALKGLPAVAWAVARGQMVYVSDHTRSATGNATANATGNATSSLTGNTIANATGNATDSDGEQCSCPTAEYLRARSVPIRLKWMSQEQVCPITPRFAAYFRSQQYIAVLEQCMACSGVFKIIWDGSEASDITSFASRKKDVEAEEKMHAKSSTKEKE